jgi:cyclophilin family peptidyl-prolyl cis-trans isomerase
MKRLGVLLMAVAFLAWNAQAIIFATFETTLGRLELELYDEDKPVTVSNFLAYVQSGKFEGGIIHRCETNFVIQGGGFYVATNNTGEKVLREVQTFPAITNEAGFGRRLGNEYGTIAMARQGTVTNSATSQWFINLRDNSHLDTFAGGYTVFGRVVSGTNLLNLFIPPSGTHGIWQANGGGALSTLPVLTNVQPDLDDLIYVDVSLRRDLGLKIAQGRTGRTLTWNSVAGMSNVVEFTPSLSLPWQELTSLPGTGGPAAYSDASNEPKRFYRVKLLLY